MAQISINTAKKVVPIIYAYTTPEITRHDGWTKIGYSEQTAQTRIGQQTNTVDVQYVEEWHKNATFDDGSGDVFHDSDFHAYLIRIGIERGKRINRNGKTVDTEWFHVDPTTAKHMLDDFRENRGILKQTDNVIPYILREEQQDAVDRAKDYFSIHEHGAFLFNAKPRFGKTLTVYDLCETMKLGKVLIVTNRPAIANSWYEDYCKFLGMQSGYAFVSEVSALQGKKHVLTRQEYTNLLNTGNETENCIEFVSLQDLKGSKYFSPNSDIDKLGEVKHTPWDILVIDEAHEGVDTFKTDIVFDNITRRYTLHLSGTPFKALANDKFPDGAIFNWTYADEQKAKADWKSKDGEQNPYANLPQLNMYTYKMSSIVEDELKQGVDIDGDTDAFCFNLNDFFETSASGYFVRNEAVNQFLDALTTQTKFPFSTDELRGELKHTLWLLNRVDSAKALVTKLRKHPVFRDYEIILAAGDGKLEDDDESNIRSFDKVKKAIAEHDKTITLSVGQLTTGVTIPEWTAVLMLSSIQSPALYMQAAFRAQNPCLFSNGSEFFRKENAYVFDFDPARTLTLFEEFANDLSEMTAAGKGDTAAREANIRELLNFFPVIGEDDNGEMIALDAAEVLSIPRKIKSQEVVKRGFMSDFLFQNIGNVFHAPQDVWNTIKEMTPAKDPGPLASTTAETGEELEINDEGEIELPDELVIGKAGNLFGDKIYDSSAQSFDDVLKEVSDDYTSDDDVELENLKATFRTEVTKPLIQRASDEYGGDMSNHVQRDLERKINGEADNTFEHDFGNYKVQKKSLEADRQNEISTAESAEEAKAINAKYDGRKKDLIDNFKKKMTETIDTMTKKAGQKVVRTVETDKREQQKRTIEDSIKDHLRGFSRTIPSFLMAYGTDSTTLENFDTVIPDVVFREVTSISLDQFRFLRDGGPFTNSETRQQEHFDGKLFDPVVFNDSVKEFLKLKTKLADYFDSTNIEDIFDYIPPQKTNQIFTPKRVVKDMVDKLESENPGCFDDPDKTFADLYMKSGMYITEIVKRLYQSNKMRALFQDSTERLNHIFAKQVYGLAPTEIIYRICIAYILGFSDEVEIKKYNIKLCDSLEYAKKGTLEMKLKELFPELTNNGVKL